VDVSGHSPAPVDADVAPLELVNCNLCGSSDQVLFFHGRDHLIGETFCVVRCRGCGLCYVNPRPSEAAVSRYYPDAYFGKRHPFLNNFFMNLRVAKLPRGAGTPRLLDIGCGLGDFILCCKRRGWDVAGVEQVGSPIMRLKDSLGIEVYELRDLETIPADHFDVVTIWHVLEHLPDPAQALTQVRRILKPGGLALIEVPNFGSWQGRLGGSAWFHLTVPRHLFQFEKQPLARLLVQHGLSPRRWQTFSLEYDTFALVQTVLNRICSRPDHLFQMLIGRGAAGAGMTKDTFLSFALAPLLLALAFPVSVVAAACGQGGVLRVWVTK
jgi:SAM-dependent methyltransferase